ncbi:MAG: hypothetical protein ACO1NY_10800 [Pseudorhodoplanes sp.]
MIASHRVALSALASAVLLAALTVGTEANPQAPKAAAAKPAKAAAAKVKTDTRVYLLRGLLNVFSLGMDALQERLSIMGFEAEVDNHNGWITIANKIVEDRKKGHNGAVVLIGHSLGADVLFQLTERLEKENVPVRLAVFFDPTISHDISKNVEHVLNLYQLNGFGRKVTAPKGYKGELVNMDLSGDASIGHGSIDKSEKLHDLVIAKIMKVAVGPAQRKRPAPAKPKPLAATPEGLGTTATPSPAAAMPSSGTKAPVAAPQAKPNATPAAQAPRI